MSLPLEEVALSALVSHLTAGQLLAGEAPPEPALDTGPLLLIALGAVLVLLFLIIRVKLHAFVALILVSLLTALATGIEIGEIVPTMTGGLGVTLGSVALLVGLGAMLGRLLEVSGGAQVLADSLIRRFGENRAPLALGVASLLFGFPIFFDAGLVVFLPIIFTVARRLGSNLLTYGLPAAGAFSVMHAFVPPHPGPVAAAELIGADVGLVLVFGLLIGLPTWFVGGYLIGSRIAARHFVPIPPAAADAPTEPQQAEAFSEAVEHGGSGGDATMPRTTMATEEPPEVHQRTPSFGTVLMVLLLPLVLIFLNTGLNTLGVAGVVDPEATWVEVGKLIGATPVALLISVLVAMWVLGWRRGESPARVETIVNDSLAPVCAIILITGAGGMFGGVLRASGIGQALGESLQATGMPVIVAAFIIALALRVAQGSATVALTTAAALIAPAIEATAGLTSADLALVVIAIAGGATMVSHVNDSGFWLVSRFFGMDEKTALKTWTLLTTVLGSIGAAAAITLSFVL